MRNSSTDYKKYTLMVLFLTLLVFVMGGFSMLVIRQHTSR